MCARACIYSSLCACFEVSVVLFTVLLQGMCTSMHILQIQSKPFCTHSGCIEGSYYIKCGHPSKIFLCLRHITPSLDISEDLSCNLE